MSLTSGNTFAVDLFGTTPGSGYTQAQVTGTISLGGATLAVNLGFSPVVGSTFTIIDNDSTDAVVGTFSSLPEGSSFVVGGNKQFIITYNGGTGNDVVLTYNGIAIVIGATE